MNEGSASLEVKYDRYGLWHGINIIIESYFTYHGRPRLSWIGGACLSETVA